MNDSVLLMEYTTSFSSLTKCLCLSDIIYIPLDVRNYEGQSPLDTALEDMYEVGYFDLVVYLISHGCGDEEDRAIVLAQACRQGRLDVVKELVEQHKVDPKCECAYCLTTS